MSGTTIGWNNATPASSDVAGLGDDEIRSLKSNLQGALDAEHLFPSGGGLAGTHRAGSGRIFSGASSRVSSADTDGRLMFESTNSRLYYVGSEGTAYLGGQNVVSMSTVIPPLSVNSMFVMSLVSATFGGGDSGPISTGMPTTGNFYFASVVTAASGNATAAYAAVYDTTGSPKVKVYNAAGTQLSGVTVTINLLSIGYGPR